MVQRFDSVVKLMQEVKQEDGLDRPNMVKGHKLSSTNTTPNVGYKQQGCTK